MTERAGDVCLRGADDAAVRHAGQMSMRVKVASIVLSAGVVLSACASSDAPASESSSLPVTSVVDEGQQADATDGVPAGESGDEPVVRRELALDLRPESDVESNPLPSVEVDDVGQGRRVNARNIFPAERPVMLWMWAPY